MTTFQHSITSWHSRVVEAGVRSGSAWLKKLGPNCMEPTLGLKVATHLSPALISRVPPPRVINTKKWRQKTALVRNFRSWSSMLINVDTQLSEAQRAKEKTNTLRGWSQDTLTVSYRFMRLPTIASLLLYWSSGIHGAKVNGKVTGPTNLRYGPPNWELLVALQTKKTEHSLLGLLITSTTMHWRPYVWRQIQTTIITTQFVT